MKKDCCQPQKIKIKVGFGLDPFILWIGVITVAILGIVIYFGSQMGKTPQVPTQQSVNLNIGIQNHDWGTIDYDQGVVSQTFPFTNNSQSVLEIYDILTSCMCTTAQLITPSQTSRKFGMHEKTGTVFFVQPGETVQLKVEFDPAFHGPSGIGPITRTVTMRTNDAAHPQLTFTLSGQVVKK